MTAFLIFLGGMAVESLRGLGQIAILLFRCLVAFFTSGFKYRKEIITQFYFIGTQSLPVVLITGAFIGAVFAYSMYHYFVALGVASWTGVLVLKMMTWHLGPVVTALILAGRVGCAITAEIGTMKVTEQVDAMETFGVDPVEYLVLPRVLAALFMMPVLTCIAIFVGTLTALLMTVTILGGDAHYQVLQMREMMIAYDYVQALVKGAVFGLIIAVVCCRSGLATSGGAEGVGKATTTANVSSSIAILIVNLIVTIALNYAEPWYDALIKVLDGLR